MPDAFTTPEDMLQADIRPQSGMELFAELVTEISSSTKTNEKLEALINYFQVASDKDKVWVIAIFSGRRPKRAVNTTQLLTWCIEVAGIPGWLFGESYHTVGDLAETIALLSSDADPQLRKTMDLSEYLEKFIAIEKQEESIRKNFIFTSWAQMTQNEQFVFNKLITGAFRIGVSQKMMVNALAKTVQLSSSVIAHRISGNWDPVSTGFEQLLSEESVAVDLSEPYPFYLAYAFEEDLHSLGEPSAWQAEWKWDGIRGQMIKRNQQLFVWSRGEELMTDKFPEYHAITTHLPDG